MTANQATINGMLMCTGRPAALVLVLLVAALSGGSGPPRAEAQGHPTPFLSGVNLSGAEFGPPVVPGGPRGRHGTEYIYPIEAYVPGYQGAAYFRAKGFDSFRLPFLWERIQPRLGAPLDADELVRLQETVRVLRASGATVILDLHNYARYEGRPIGAGDVTADHLADVWRRLADALPDDPHLWLGLMNEPYGVASETWVDAANAAIAAMRRAGHRHTILVAGNGYSNAWTWDSGRYGTPNAIALAAIRDPLDRVVFEAHLYLDANGSGTSATCVDVDIGAERLAPFLAWLKATGRRGYVGEIGAGASAVCMEAVRRALARLCAARNEIVGWAWWSAGPWWPADYFTRVEPRGAEDAPQLATLAPFLGGRCPAAPAPLSGSMLK